LNALAVVRAYLGSLDKWIACGVFTSVRDARKLMRYIRACSKTARPFEWAPMFSAASNHAKREVYSHVF
jgi:hypothetical protein